MKIKDWRSNTVVVTGSSGSGKSTVCEMLAEHGALVLKADEFARKALEPSSPATSLVKQEFGSRFFPNGTLDRKLLAQHVFSNPLERERLEKIVHPIVSKLATEAFEQKGGDKAPLVIYDCPLFFEAGLGAENFRSVVAVTAEDEIKIARIVARDKISPAEAKMRLENQWSDEDKAKLANLAIENNNDLQSLREKVARLYKSLAKDF